MHLLRGHPLQWVGTGNPSCGRRGLTSVGAHVSPVAQRGHTVSDFYSLPFCHLMISPHLHLPQDPVLLAIFAPASELHLPAWTLISCSRPRISQSPRGQAATAVGAPLPSLSLRELSPLRPFFKCLLLSTGSAGTPPGLPPQLDTDGLACCHDRTTVPTDRSNKWASTVPES